MIQIDPTLNPLEVMIVAEHLKKHGVEHYRLTHGNGCIYAAYYGAINEYYIFKDGVLVDIQID